MPIILPDGTDNEPPDLPTEPGWYLDQQGDVWRIDGERRTAIASGYEHLVAQPGMRFTRLLTRAEAGLEIQERIATVAPMGAELRHDGTEDPGMAAWVEGLRDAHGVVQEYIDGGDA